jgi:hypothetical protein
MIDDKEYTLFMLCQLCTDILEYDYTEEELKEPYKYIKEAYERANDKPK